MRGRAVLVVGLLGLFGATGCVPSGGPVPGCVSPSNEARALFDAVNEDREANGRGPVVWDQDLADLAAAWAQHLAGTGVLAHSGREGENVSGPGVCITSAQQVEAAYMASPPHRANIINGQWTSLGTAWVVDGQGRVWTVQQFGFDPELCWWCAPS